MHIYQWFYGRSAAINLYNTQPISKSLILSHFSRMSVHNCETRAKKDSKRNKIKSYLKNVSA